MTNSWYFFTNSCYRWSVTPVAIPVRIAFITILVCGCLLYWHWKAGIISNLSVQKFIPPFLDLPGLLLTTFKVSTLKGSSYQNLFDDPAAKNPLFYQVWERKMRPFQESSLVATKQDGVDQLLNDPTFTHFDTTTALKSFPEYRKCEIMSIPRDIYSARYVSFSSRIRRLNSFLLSYAHI